MTDDRHVCTADDPWTPDKGRAIHPDAAYISDRDYGGGEYCEKYRCPHCGKTFEVELAPVTDDFFDHVNAELAVPEPQTVKVDVTVDLAQEAPEDRLGSRLTVPNTGRVFCPGCGLKLGSVARELPEMARHLRVMHQMETEAALALASRLVRCGVWLMLSPEQRGDFNDGG